jgi:hypothetical protein
VRLRTGHMLTMPEIRAQPARRSWFRRTLIPAGGVRRIALCRRALTL